MIGRSCRNCGAHFAPRVGQQHYCDDQSCRAERARTASKKRDRKRGRVSWAEYIAKVGLKERACQHCGLTFKPRASAEITYCSRACAFAAKAATPKYTSITRCAVCRGFIRAKAKVCANCRPGHERARELSRNMARHRRVARSCPECAVQFSAVYGHGLMVFCSTRCARRNASITGKAKRSAARVVGVRVGRVATFERDGWACYWCGESTPRELMGSVSPKAPELDHVIPVASGGKHVPENVVCACRECNGVKSDKDKQTFIAQHEPARRHWLGQ